MFIVQVGLVLMLLGENSSAFGVTLPTQCTTFYAAMGTLSTERVPEWLRGSIPALSKAYLQKDAQARFEVDALKLTSRLDLIDEHSLAGALNDLFTGRAGHFKFVIIYHNNKSFIEVHPGEKPPKGYVIHQGIYPDSVYYSAIAKGLYPIGDVSSKVSFFGAEIPESTVQHGLAHAGGFHASGKYANYIRRLASLFLVPRVPIDYLNFRKISGFFSEALWVANKKQSTEIREFLRSIEHIIPRAEISDMSPLYFKIKSLPESQISELARMIIANLPEITPLGGGSRDYSEKQAFLEKKNFHPDSQEQGTAANGYSMLTDLSMRESIHFLELKKAFEEKDQNKLASSIAAILIKAKFTMKLRLSDWFNRTVNYNSAENTMIRDYICRSGVFGKRSSTYNAFCI